MVTTVDFSREEASSLPCRQRVSYPSMYLEVSLEYLPQSWKKPSQLRSVAVISWRQAPPVSPPTFLLGPASPTMPTLLYLAAGASRGRKADTLDLGAVSFSRGG